MPMTTPMLAAVGRSNSTPTTPSLTSDSVSRASVAATDGFIRSDTFRRVRILLYEKLISGAEDASNLKKAGGYGILHEKTRLTPSIVLNQPIECKVARRKSRISGVILARGPMTWAEISYIRRLTPATQAAESRARASEDEEVGSDDEEIRT